MGGRLFSTTLCGHYETEFKAQVDLKVGNIMTELSSSPERDPGNFSVLEIRKAVKLLKTKNACGNDNI